MTLETQFTVGPWRLPDRLLRLIERGFWPRTQEAAIRQNLECLVAKDTIRCFAPEEDGLHLFAPPFFRVADYISVGETFWTDPMAAPSGISFEHSVVIGGFGMGSDAPIILDYRLEPDCPRVLRLLWGEGFSPKNEWVVAAENFDRMCELLNFPKT